MVQIRRYMKFRLKKEGIFKTVNFGNREARKHIIAQ